MVCIILGEKEKHGTYWYKLLTSRSSRVHKTVYERLHVLEFDSNRKVIINSELPFTN